MSRIQQTVVLDLQTSNILISVNYLPISSVATKDFHFEESTERYSSTENTLYRRRIEMVNAPWCSNPRIRCIQKAHIAFVPASAAKRKNRIDNRKIQAEKTKTVYRQSISLQKKESCITECFNDWGGRGCDDLVPGEVNKRTPSGDRITRSPTWSASLPRVQLISPPGWSNTSPSGAMFVPSPPKTGTNLWHPRPPQLLNDSTKVFPYRTACFGRLTTLSSLAAGQLVVSQTPLARWLVKWLRCCCRPFRLLVELAAK